MGGYAFVALMNRYGWPFFSALPITFILCAVMGLIFERTLYRRLYKASHLDQVLFTIGLTFVATSIASFAFGLGQQIVNLPDWLQGYACRVQPCYSRAPVWVHACGIFLQHRGNGDCGRFLRSAGSNRTDSSSSLWLVHPADIARSWRRYPAFMPRGHLRELRGQDA